MGENKRQGVEKPGESLRERKMQLEEGPSAPTVACEPPSRALVVLAFGAVYLVWGSTYLGIKYSIETLPPLLMAGSRFLIAGLLLFGWARFRSGGDKRRWEHPRLAHWRTALIVGALLFLCGNGGVTWAENRIASSLAALLVATEPLWIVLLSWALRGNSARPTGKVVLGLLAGFAGVWLLVGEGVRSGDVDPTGALLVIGAAFAWAIGSLYSVRASLPASPSLSAGMQMIAGGALLIFAGTVSGEWAGFRISEVSLRSTLAFVYLVVFGSIIAFTAYSWLLHNVSPARAATYAYINPVVAVFLGWALAGELLTTRTLAAAAIIVASVVLITSGGKQKSDERSAPASEQNLARTKAVEADKIHCPSNTAA